ncbi:MAG: winged helix-turn-helix domain-containing protein [Betaproteobacteria bacterium]|nr:winged helix-turn-helix domain-containing protein [Betaproteobacteria bacterium]
MKYRFLNCELDTDRQELTVDGRARAVEPQVFSLLTYLVANRDRVVSRDELNEAVWHGRIVSDETLSSRISAARKAIGDNGREQVAIRTVARRGFRFVAEVDGSGEAPPSAGAPAAPSADRPAVAVLAFGNMSGDADQEYLSDGLSEDIIAALLLWGSFPVVSRNSSFAYKGRFVDVKQIGRELGARYVLEGSVRRIANRLRISAQLIDATTGHHVWGERYDRVVEDVFAVQDDISRKIASIVEPALGRAEYVRSSAKQPDNLSAWDYYLRGRWHLHDYTREGNQKARAFFERSIALDPEFARAHADLALSYSRDLLLHFAEDREVWMSSLIDAAQTAVRLDRASSRAHIVLSTGYLWRNQLELAIKEGRLAVELNPSDADALHQLGNILDVSGDSEGIPMMEKALGYQAQSPQRHMQLTFLARAYVNRGNHARAVDCADAAIAQRPDYPHAHYIKAVALSHLGRLEEADAALRACEDAHPGFVRDRAEWTPYPHAGAGNQLIAGLPNAERFR